MQSVVLVRENPRSLALRPAVTPANELSSVLVFDHLHYSPDKPAKCSVNIYSADEFPITEYSYLNSRPVYGCLGLIDVSNETFLAVITECQPIGCIRPNEKVYRIKSVSFYSLSSNIYDESDFGYREPVDEYDSPDQITPPGVPIHPCAQLQKLFLNGAFYFTPDFDLTRTVQARTMSGFTGLHSFDPHFLWNNFMIKELLNFRSKLSELKQHALDMGGFLVLAIQGYIGIEECYVGNQKIKLSIISKLSCKRAGTRFNTRGIDDNGNVANFVETETIMHAEDWCFTYTQIRGSVPVFWEQPGLQVMNHKILISRGAEATQPAVERHFAEQLHRYNNVHIINLLSQKEHSGEASLTNAYGKAVQKLMASWDNNRLRMVNFDFHAECRGGNYDNITILNRRIRDQIESFGFFLYDSERGQIVLQQTGVFRTNCIDCLDRTNVVQSELSRLALQLHFQTLDKKYQHGSDDTFLRHSNLWAENGDGLSKIYAGTGALKSSFTRNGKVNLMSVLGDAAKSANRFYINNFTDKAKQEVIDQLLGKLVSQREIIIHDPIHDSVLEIMHNRLHDYSTRSKVTIFAGTYNLNGKTYKGESLAAWLFASRQVSFEPDIYMIAFQEIVELSPQQIMSTDETKRAVWEHHIEQILNSRSESKTKYVLLRSGQLVGAALLIFVKESCVGKIRNVEAAIKKTGLGGMAGNKGAVAIRMEYCDTSFCFVTAHLAAGHLAVEQRDMDYHTIADGLFFARGRKIDNHDNIIWAGDFNYRIQMSNEEVRLLLAQGDIETLLEYDQLQREISNSAIFKGYKEGIITFAPTYKYDNGTDIYDSSDKQRIPAWTDRILFQGPQLRQVSYTRAELYTSDHRPVLSVFEAEVLQLDNAAKEKIQRQLYQERSLVVLKDSIRPVPKQVIQPMITQVSTGQHGLVNEISKASMSSMPAEDILIDLSSEHTGNVQLPPPSSDTYRWWEDNDDDIVRKQQWWEEDGLDALVDIPSAPRNVVDNGKPMNPFIKGPIRNTTKPNTATNFDPFGDVLEDWVPVASLLQS